MKRHPPAATRNQGPIGDVLARELPPRGLVLEVASGSGLHAAAFAARFPALTWQPTDIAPEAIASIAAWRDETGAPNLLPPLVLDATAADWPVPAADAVVSVNMVHIAPWAACEGLLAGAARLLRNGRDPAAAPLVLYGPFYLSDRPTAPSNEAFNASLRARDPAWGVRRLDDVAAAAARHGLTLRRVHDMPANNTLAVFRSR